MISGDLLKYCEELEQDIQNAYDEGVTLPDAEKLAAKFLGAQMRLAKELQNADLDARMRKSGVKAIRGALYMNLATKDAKKPSDVLIENSINTEKLYMDEQQSLDEAEVERDTLERYYNIFREGHIFMRGVSRGKFE